MKNGQHDLSAGPNRAYKASFVLSKTISAIFSFPSIYADLPRLVSRGPALCRPREFPRTHLLPTFLALSESSFRLSARILRISCHFQSFLAYKFSAIWRIPKQSLASARLGDWRWHFVDDIAGQRDYLT
jgi:hypothetical protein